MSDSIKKFPKGFIMIPFNGREHLVNINSIAMITPCKDKEGNPVSALTFIQMMYPTLAAGTTKTNMPKTEQTELKVVNSLNQVVVPIEFLELLSLIEEAQK